MKAHVRRTSSVLFENVRIFDGKATALSTPSHILVRGNKIVRVSLSPIEVENRVGAMVIDGAGRTLMPGLIDAHAHMLMESIPLGTAMTSEVGYLHLVAGQAAEKQLLRGFTTVRDVGGPSFALKRAIDEELLPGPRIYPSGAMISQTSGHGDFRLANEHPLDLCCAPLSFPEQAGVAAIADGVPQVLLRVRENLKKGASQIKVMAGGGVTSNYDTLDVRNTPSRK